MSHQGHFLMDQKNERYRMRAPALVRLQGAAVKTKMGQLTYLLAVIQAG